MNTTNIFPRIFAAIIESRKTETNDFINSLNEAAEISDIFDTAYFTQYMTPAKKKQEWGNISDLRAYIISRRQARDKAYLAEKLAHLCAVSDAPEFTGEIEISVEWKKSRTWGANPTASLRMWGGEFNRFSGHASGCGYDKESAAIAEALNQSLSIKKALYKVKEESPKIDNRDLFGYGSGYGILPYFEGGVGADCYRSIFQKIGFSWAKVGSGKTFDYYKATKLAAIPA